MAVPVYVDRAAKHAFACAVDWPGWCRSGPDEDAALEALVASAPRIGRAMKRRRLAVPAVRTVSDLRVVERVKGNATTDFGAPGVAAKVDARAATPADLRKLGEILDASWREFDAMAAAAKGKTLAKGPRGGGRSLAKIVDHVVGAEAAYIGAVGGTFKDEGGGSAERLKRVRAAFVKAVAARARGEVPDRGPRGGKRWGPRFAVRRSAWHWLDHAWEIEDRSA